MVDSKSSQGCFTASAGDRDLGRAATFAPAEAADEAAPDEAAPDEVLDEAAPDDVFDEAADVSAPDEVLNEAASDGVLDEAAQDEVLVEAAVEGCGGTRPDVGREAAISMYAMDDSVTSLKNARWLSWARSLKSLALESLVPSIDDKGGLTRGSAVAVRDLLSNNVYISTYTCAIGSCGKRCGGGSECMQPRWKTMVTKGMETAGGESGGDRR